MPDFTITSFDRRKWTGKDTPAGRGYEEEWVVGFTGPWNPAALLAHTQEGKPKKNTRPSWDSSVIATGISVDVDGDARTDDGNPASQAIYSVTYEPINYELVRKAVHPLDRPQIKQGGGSDLTEVRLDDADGNPMVNSSADFYLDLPEQPIPGVDFSITRNEENNPISIAAQFSNRTNQTVWYGRPIGTVWLGKITYREVLELFDDGLGGPPEEVTYWEVTYPFRDRPDGWNFKPLDCGLNESDGNYKYRIFDKSEPDPQPVPQPVLLDGAGNQLEEGGTPVYFPADGRPILRKAEFADLDLDDPYT